MPDLPKTPILVTGGAGFIGSHFVRSWVRGGGHVVNFDALTYAGDLARLAEANDSPRHTFARGDVTDAQRVAELLDEHQPAAVVHLAAESHVDRSIDSGVPFVATNVVGTQVLLEKVVDYWTALDAPHRDAFRFLYVSTDEVFGDAAPDEAFNEDSPFRPNSPYAASKAGADHLVRAARQTFGLPTITIHPANVLGPYQLPEKLIPLITLRAAAREPLPIYGDGMQERDWFFVDDLCVALNAALLHAAPGERYVAGGGGECWTNLRIVETICELVDAIERADDQPPRKSLITHVADRPGHDRRYALDCAKIERDLGWRPRVGLQEALRSTVTWYLENRAWVESVQRGNDLLKRRGLRETEE